MNSFLLISGLVLSVMKTIFDILFNEDNARRYWLRCFVGNLIMSLILVGTVLLLDDFESKWIELLLVFVIVFIASLFVNFVLNKVWPVKK